MPASPGPAGRTGIPTLPDIGRYDPSYRAPKPRSGARSPEWAGERPPPRRSIHHRAAGDGEGKRVPRSRSEIPGCPPTRGGWSASSSVSSGQRWRAAEYAMLRKRLARERPRHPRNRTEGLRADQRGGPGLSFVVIGANGPRPVHSRPFSALQASSSAGRSPGKTPARPHRRWPRLSA